jgi:membrane-associated protease RseP (regulator of RpoE activity)
VYFTWVGVLVAALVALVVIDYEPGKLAWLLFVFFWIVQLPIHEAGHALMARWLGWHVKEVVIGMGRTVARIEIGGLSVEIRQAPTMGYVLPQPSSLENFRLKNALVYFAGPGIELVVLAGLVGVVGADRLLAESVEPLMIAAKMLAAVIVTSTFFNLWPHETQVGGRFVANDGLGILWSFQKPMSFFVSDHPSTDESETR